MKEYIAFDSHKHYTLAERENARTGRRRQKRIDHRPGAIREFLQDCEPGTPVAVEAVGNWYWIIDEIEQANCRPLLVHPRKAKLMMGMLNKTDSLDAHGLNRLQRNGTVPTVWIASGELRDLRELTRARMTLSGQRTQIKNRVLAILEKHLLAPRGIADLFGRKGRAAIEAAAERLGEQARWVLQAHLREIDFLSETIREQERRLLALLEATESMQLLKTIPGIGVILSVTIALEIGEVSRFASAERLASYSGTTPRVHASGGKVRYGRTRPDVNRILKWAFAEAANSIVVNHRRYPDRYASRLYVKVRARRGHPKAVGAVARHLAESAWHVLTRQEAYKERP